MSNSERFIIWNNYYKGEVVIDTEISDEVDDDTFKDNIVAEYPSAISSLVDILNKLDVENKYLKKKLDMINCTVKVDDIEIMRYDKVCRKWVAKDETHQMDRIIITRTGYVVDTKTDVVYLETQALINDLNKAYDKIDELEKENKKINSQSEVDGEVRYINM